jgi:DNA-binding NarL/FixJ family response regulator
LLPSQRFTKRHQEVLHLVSKGLRNAEIGHQLGLTERSVKGYVSQLLLIFDVTNRTELVGLFVDSLECPTLDREAKGASAGR